MRKIQYILSLFLILFAVSLLAKGQQDFAGNMESVFMTTDRSTYFAGEEIWMRPVCLDGDNRVNEDSKVVYVELLTAANEPVIQTILLLREGYGEGNLSLPSYLSSGFYLLRAYTNYMKNFGAGSFFTKKLLILNPVQGGRFNYPDVKEVSPADAQIRILPEGDSIYRNLDNRVYIRFNDPLPEAGRKAWIVDQYYDTVVTARFIRKDLAWFDFIPGPQKYYLVIPGAESWYPLVISQQKGTILKVESSFERFGLSLESNDTVVKASGLTLEIHNVADPPGKVIRRSFTPPVIIENSTVGEGFIKLTIRQESGKTIAENFIYIRPGGKLKVNVSSDKKLYGNRERAELSMRTTDEAGKPVSTRLAITVRKKSGNAVPGTTLPSFLVIPAELKAIASDWNLDDPYEAAAFMRLYEKQIFSGPGERGELKYVHEHSGILVSGSLEKKGKPLPGAPVYFSVVGDSTLVYPQKTSDNGHFTFPVHDLTGERDVIVKTEDTIRDAYFNLENEYFSEYSRFTEFPENMDPQFTQSLSSLYYAWQVRRSYNLEDARLVNGCTRDFDFFGSADFSIQMKNYVELPLLEEVFFEIVPPVMVLHKEKQAYLKVIDRQTNRTIGDHPLYLVDGVPLFDPSIIMALPPSVIREIKVFQKQYFLGGEVFDGIIVINTLNNDFTDVDYNGSYTRKRMHFARRQNEFVPPDYSQAKVPASKPDFRNILLWAPDVKTGGDGTASREFFTADEDAEYEVVAEGLDPAGHACYGSYTFRVGKAR